MTRDANSRSLVKRLLRGEARATAELLTAIESGDGRARAALKAIYPHTGRAHVVGVSGPAGSGKSVLIDRITAELRRRQRKVAILAVDPTSPRSGGALLGDRVRMKSHFLDPEVFIRSFATRGSRGGVCAAIWGAIHCLDAMGKDVVLVETIGAGQDEIAVSEVSHTVLLVLTPWSGDEIQRMKAGLVEIAHVVVINKCDLPGAEDASRQLAELYADGGRAVVRTSALHHRGIGELVDEIERRGARLLAGPEAREARLNFCRRELLALLAEEFHEQARKKLASPAAARLLRHVSTKRLDPYTAVEKITRSLLRGEAR
ncbi:MAG TPA: methylmalonyl Co-A mutase-associated GTPase MeaB [Candidatus Acidoferrales bacterium]|nr:methylmalonyl Co-A mutase-associated GTPase MeaB [Candidatus Acidoferrales bacterium]